MYWRRLWVAAPEGRTEAQVLGIRSDGETFYVNFIQRDWESLGQALEKLEEFRVCSCTAAAPCEKHTLVTA